MAEIVPDTDSQALHHFLAHSPWDSRAVMDQVAHDVDALLGGEADVGVSALRPPGHHAEAARAMVFCFFANAAVVCLYALMAELFPVQLRAGGTGFVIGTGRGGAAIAPVIAGGLFGAGFSLAQVSLCMALGSVIALAALLRLRISARKPALA